jgi:hypothetical protein
VTLATIHRFIIYVKLDPSTHDVYLDFSLNPGVTQDRTQQRGARQGGPRGQWRGACRGGECRGDRRCWWCRRGGPPHLRLRDEPPWVLGGGRRRLLSRPSDGGSRYGPMVRARAGGRERELVVGGAGRRPRVADGREGLPVAGGGPGLPAA